MFCHFVINSKFKLYKFLIRKLNTASDINHFAVQNLASTLRKFLVQFKASLAQNKHFISISIIIIHITFNILLNVRKALLYIFLLLLPIFYTTDFSFLLLLFNLKSWFIEKICNKDEKEKNFQENLKNPKIEKCVCWYVDVKKLNFMNYGCFPFHSILKMK